VPAAFQLHGKAEMLLWYWLWFAAVMPLSIAATAIVVHLSGRRKG
jgi:hypothetical protein